MPNRFQSGHASRIVTRASSAALSVLHYECNCPIPSVLIALAMDEPPAEELLAMKAEDLRVRNELKNRQPRFKTAV